MKRFLVGLVLGAAAASAIAMRDRLPHGLRIEIEQTLVDARHAIEDGRRAAAERGEQLREELDDVRRAA